MINQNHNLSIVRQCNTLELARSDCYCTPKPGSDADLKLMRLIDQIHLHRLFLGSRCITDALQDSARPVNRKRVQRLMRRMRIHGVCPNPNLSKANQQNKIYPCLFRNLKIDRLDQVQASAITHIPMSKGFVYPAVIMDGYSRKILSWRLSISMGSSFCVDALEQALYRYGKPDIFNTNQGSQYTSEAFTDVLKANGIRISKPFCVIAKDCKQIHS